MKLHCNDFTVVLNVPQVYPRKNLALIISLEGSMVIEGSTHVHTGESDNGWRGVNCICKLYLM